MFGTLTWQAFVHTGAVETGASLAVVCAGLFAVVLITYLGRWRWLWREWLTSLDHKRIGSMYLVLSAVMLGRGFIDAAMMRSQQALSVGDAMGYLSPDHFAQLFTAHGTIMIFFGAMTFMFGLINLIVPLQLGARDVAFPLLNSVSFWLTAAAAMLVNVSLVAGQFAATGWLAYPPLSELAWSPGVGVDYWIWGLQVAGAGTLLSGINFIATILTMRKPDMPLMKMPMLLWTTLGAMFLVLFAFPILTVTLALLGADRTLGMHFFTTDLGGNAMLYVNLIWAWGHPEVYILILPAFGIFSEVVATFSHKRLFGYTSMVVATMLITLLSFMVWVHHFFTMGAGADVNAFFGIMTMAIAVPTGVKIFNWLFTMFRGRIEFKTPMLWFMGFVVTFTLGGMSGVLLSIPGVDYQLHNSLFLIAHFHNMIVGGVLFGFFAGFTYWFPKYAGFTLDERLGRRAFWCWFWGFLLAFMPLYALGLMGMTRRVDHLPQGFGWEPLLWLAGAGVCVIALGACFQIAQLVVSYKNRALLRASDNPWQSRGPEWAPLPPYDSSHNTPLGLAVGVLAFCFGFGMVWHMWWLAALGIAGIALSLAIRSFAPEHV